MTKQSKKVFSLIHGNSVHIAPKTKIIPAEQFSTLQNAEKLLQEVKQDAELFKKEIAAEVEKEKEIAQREGYEKGFQEWIEKIAELEEEIKKVRKDTEQIIIPIAIKAAKKIVSRELELSEDTIVNIVRDNLKAVAQHKRIAIYINPEEFSIVEEHRNQLKEIFESLEALSIRPRADVKRGGCVIETEGGIINAQIDNRWRILEAAFEKLSVPKNA